MKALRYLLFLLLSFSNLYSQKTTIEWDGNKVLDYGSFKYDLPFFKNENYSVINGVPYLTYTKRDKEASQYEIKNLVWEKIDAKNRFGLNEYNVQNKEIAYANSQNQLLDGQYITNVVIATFKKDAKNIYRLVSYDLVKKT